MGEFALGQAVPRFEDLRLLRGGGRYVSDMVLPYMAYGYVLRSPHAAAKIVKLDTAAALKAPGVLAVLTGEDWKASGFGDLPRGLSRKLRDGKPMFSPPYPPLVDGQVRHVGDPVAFVVAETLAQAMDAAELIEVDYQPLRAVTNAVKALEPGAPKVWDACGDNISFVHVQGDKAATDEAFAKADRVVKHRLVINRVTAATMEPRGSIGVYSPTEDHFTVYTTLQRAHSFREELSEVLGMPESKIRVIAGDIGGSFGMKSPVYNEVGMVLLAAKLIGRPVKWTATRSESFLSDANARDLVSDGELALDKDGKFLALRVRNIANVGAYVQTGGDSSPVANLGSLAGVYILPAIHVDVTAVLTNTHPVRPYRGNGRPEAAFVIERLIDIAADEMKIDPAEIRRRNLIPSSAMPFKTALGSLYDCGEFEQNMDMAMQMADYAGFAKRREESKARGKLRGLGISNSIERAASPGFEGAEIRFDRSGEVTILSGAVAQGQGHETTFKQLVCDRLGLDPMKVQYVQGDTDKVFFGEGTGGSRTATIGGGAMKMATDKIVAKATRIAAHMFGVAAEDVQFKDGIFSSKASNRTMNLHEIARESLSPKNLPPGEEMGLIANAVFHTTAINYPNGTHICELEIDPETGTVEILRYNVVDDVGNVLNPLMLHGQIIGGIGQGLGQILMEDMRYDEEGQLLSGSFQDYAMPRAEHFSMIQVKSNPVPTATNPLGVKGAGEAGCVGAMPTIANALVDALSDYGVVNMEMPATPERIWRIIQKGRVA
ncbi:MAG TPA: xanthine dehydrogenase family protein molybdopterin-binding subunit [Alphaproteobacteria bacterium]|nr:xanthine dehydrogenase family protein molybdopterin-binding subunit [Alphaproteobacteria bacterium]